MKNHIALIDTNVLIPFNVVNLPGFENTSTDFIRDFLNLKIDKCLVHKSIFDELGNLYKLNFGTNAHDALIDKINSSSYYTVLREVYEDKNNVTKITSKFPSKWTKDYSGKKSVHRGIGTADAQFIISAMRIAEQNQFDKFSILTRDYDLQQALSDSRIGLKKHLVFENQLRKPTYKLEPFNFRS